jgi:Leucine-rich repeat (LRR) protein
MYLSSSSKSYEKKYRKYKNKYKILKSYIGGTLLNGGDCDPLPNSEEDDIGTANNLLDLCPDERITIQNKCYEVRGLYRWVITDNHDILPGTQTVITLGEKQRLIQAYEELSLAPNILNRDKLIRIYPNLQQVTSIDLSRRGYTDIALGTFSNLPNLRFLYLDYNQIKKLQPNIFNLPNLYELWISNNKIQELQPGIFNYLPNLNGLYLNNNYLRVFGAFDYLPRLHTLNLSYNHLTELNQIRRLQPLSYNHLTELNQIRRLQPFRYVEYTLINILPELKFLYLNDNQIQELPPLIFKNLRGLEELHLRNNPIRNRIQFSLGYYGLSDNIYIN